MIEEVQKQIDISEANVATLQREIADLHALNITVEPMISGATQAQLRALLYNSSARENFISAFVRDAVSRGYDGYHLDWEFGNINTAETVLFAEFLVQFKERLPVPMRLSAAVGGFWTLAQHCNVSSARRACVNVHVPTLKDSGVVLYSMDT